ncbi:class I SAM-dependent methyltransferase [Alienimonas chondri]|uniref:Methyltransferase type 11 domain-containing protein n=1 Tax=Alienimonas chondri TaxID=2681879 RepID=A0ABX1VE01_9PLAN|nr:class I SAM-dependent methyltransferase [Alienimonas chondri]NNJ26320.1 hypothetical protein [Alienimonas chondri]
MSAASLRLAAAEASAGLLRCPPAEVKEAGPGNLAGVVWRQWRTERALAARGIEFRSADPAQVEAAYAAMTAEEFNAVNGRQAWANWRTIPASLDGLLPDEPVRALDLGCGTGRSTAVLAYCLPDGSTVTGIEFAVPLVEVARGREYPNRSGRCTVRFAAGSVCGPLTNADGETIADGSIDCVNSSGLLGHHLAGDDLQACLNEVARVLTANGVAALDPGPGLSSATLKRAMAERGFQFVRRTRSNPLDRCGQAVFIKQASEGA